MRSHFNILTYCFVLSILIFNVAIDATAERSRVFSITDTPGEILFAITIPDQDTCNFVIGHSSDYGATVDYVIQNGVRVMQYHRPSQRLIFTDQIYDEEGNWIDGGLYISDDFGETSEKLSDDTPGYQWGLDQNQDSLIFSIGINQWSFDTLRTIRYGSLIGVIPRSIDWCMGWETGELVYFARSRDDDTTIVMRANAFSDTFRVLHRNTLYRTLNAGIFKGYAPGEIYHVADSLHVSTDWGATWRTTCDLRHPDFGHPMGWDATLCHGWEPGQLFLFDYYIGWENGLPRYRILFTTDYGETWHEGYPPNEVDPSHVVAIPTQSTLSVWPNPTNGQVQIELSRPTHFPLSLLDIQGRLIRSYSIPENNVRTSIHLPDIAAGVYYLTLTSYQPYKLLYVK